MPNVKDINQLIKMILRLGISSVMLLCGVGLLIAGALIPLEWPAWVIAGSVILVAGMLVMGLEIVQEILKAKTDGKKAQASINRANIKSVKKVS